MIEARTALVGGGATGIGRAVAEALARHGDRVVISGRREAVLADAASAIRGSTGGYVDHLVSDVTDAGSARATVKAVVERHGSLDVLVLNAGGPPPGRVLDVDDAQWQSAFELLVLGPLRLARLALPLMAEGGFGRVVVVTSTAVRQPQPDLAASVVLRSATTSAAKLLSREYADRGVTVNCVAPGATDTARRREIIDSRSRATGAPRAELDAHDVSTIPAGRAARPDEVAAAVVFLASSEASFVNGTVLTVDGGRTETI